MGRIRGSGNVLVMEEWPHKVLDTIRKEFNKQSDGELGLFLGVYRSTLSKIRHGTNQVSAEFIIKAHKATKWPIERIENLVSEDKHEKAGK
jgi:plasmid maintenance system antidote protein VapI